MRPGKNCSHTFATTRHKINKQTNYNKLRQMIPYDQATNYNKTRHFCNNKKQNLANKYQNTNFRVEIAITLLQANRPSVFTSVGYFRWSIPKLLSSQHERKKLRLILKLLSNPHESKSLVWQIFVSGIGLMSTWLSKDEELEKKPRREISFDCLQSNFSSRLWCQGPPLDSLVCLKNYNVSIPRFPSIRPYIRHLLVYHTQSLLMGWGGGHE